MILSVLAEFAKEFKILKISRILSKCEMFLMNAMNQMSKN